MQTISYFVRFKNSQVEKYKVIYYSKCDNAISKQNLNFDFSLQIFNIFILTSVKLYGFEASDKSE